MVKVDLRLGDCLDVLPTIPTASIDAVITDPPYAIPTLTAQRRQQVRNIGDFSIVEGYFRSWFIEVRRVLKPTGRVFVFCDSIFYPVVFRASYNNFKTALLVWDKGRIGMGREFRRTHELILHAWLDDTEIHSDGIGHSDIVKFAPVPNEKRVHPAEKPVGLLKYLCGFCGETILDTFMGSGTTGVACVQSSKDKFIGIEIMESYYATAEKLIREAQLQIPMELNV